MQFSYQTVGERNRSRDVAVARKLLVLPVALLFFQSLAIAQPVEEDTQTQAAKNAAQAATFADEEASRYKIIVGNDKSPLKLEEKPLLHWTNPVRAEVYGSIHLWTSAGCPQALASIYTYFDRKQFNAELVSLAESPLQAERNGKLRWKAEAGVKFNTLAEGPVPENTAKKRLLQMRSLARKFTAMQAERDEETKLSELRLLARPLFTYEATDKSGRDGALFAFVTANDPEVLLMIESRPAKDAPGGRTWHYAAARVHFCRLQLVLDGKAVWDVPQLAPPWEKLRGPAGEYIILEWRSAEAAAAD